MHLSEKKSAFYFNFHCNMLQKFHFTIRWHWLLPLVGVKHAMSHFQQQFWTVSLWHICASPFFNMLMGGFKKHLFINISFHFASCSEYTFGVSEWLNLTAFLETAEGEVHMVHISRVIIAYTFESLSSHTYITHNLQATINLKKNYIKNETQKSEGTH